jgi:hypothetical protein
MPTLDERQETPFIKALYIGDSSTGKTGSLVSLVSAGYKLRIIDLDAGIGTLASFIKKQCPDKLKNVSFISPRDKLKTSPSGIVLDGAPKAFIETMAALDKWEDGSEPKDWGDDTILVVDSLTALGKASYNWFERLNPGVKDKRQVYFAGQDAIEDFVINVTAEEFRTNVIIISHVTYNEAQTKGYTSALGKALGPKLPKYFNNLFLAESKGSGDNVKRIVRTVPTGIVDLKNEAPFSIPKELPLETGMATIFSTLKGK